MANFDIWVNGNDVQVYQSDVQFLITYKLDGDYLTFISDKEISYDKTDFFNSQETYFKSPTLVVITHGASLKSTAGYGLDDFQGALARNTARQLNISDSQVHIMQIDWASNTPNDVGSKDVANHINAFLNKDRIYGVQLDVMLIGHSRGAIFNFEAAKLLNNDKIGTLQMIMLDPTAVPMWGDTYPSAALKNVDQTVVYDDGVKWWGTKLFSIASGATIDGQKISGAEYRKVDLGFGETFTNDNHVMVASYYANGGGSVLDFQDDLSWLIKQKATAIDKYSENTSGSEVFSALGSTNDWISFKASWDGKNATVAAELGIASVGVSVGMDGIAAGVNTIIGGVNGVVSLKNVAVGANVPGVGVNASLDKNGINTQIQIGGFKENISLTPRDVHAVVDKLEASADKITAANAKAAAEKVAADAKAAAEKAAADVKAAAAKAAADVKAAAEKAAADAKAAAAKAAADLKAAADKITAANAKAAAEKAAAAAKAAAEKAAADAKAAADRAAADLKAAVNNAGKGISKAFKKFSDIRLKENIVKTGEIEGINIYTYNYLGDSVLQRGVMAQELLGTNFANAVEMQDNGFYAVDYSLLPELQ